MIRCPHCGMLNKAGGLHCGACGDLLATADHAAVSEAPTSDRVGGGPDEGVGARVPGVPEVMEEAVAGKAVVGPPPPTGTTMALRLNMFDEPIREGEEEPSAQETIMGMRLVAEVERVHPFSSGSVGAREEPMLLARAASPAEDQAEGTSDDSPLAPAPLTDREGSASGNPPAQFQTLFGMRAAELQLGAQAARQSSTPPPVPDMPGTPTPPPLPPESFEDVEDTSDFEVIRSSELDAVVEHAASGLTAPGEMEEYEEGGQGPISEPPIPPAGAVKGLDPALLVPATIPIAESITRPAAAGPGPGAARAKPPPIPGRASLPPPSGPRERMKSPGPLPRPAPSVQRPRLSRRAAMRPVPVASRVLQLVAGLALLGSSFLPFSESVWTSAARGIDLLVDLAPIALGLVTIALAIPAAVPSLERAVLGLLAVAVGAFILADAGTAPFREGGAVAVRFSLIAVGCVLLFVLGLIQLSSSSAEPTAPPPPE